MLCNVETRNYLPPSSNYFGSLDRYRYHPGAGLSILTQTNFKKRISQTVSGCYTLHYSTFLLVAQIYPNMISNMMRLCGGAGLLSMYHCIRRASLSAVSNHLQTNPDCGHKRHSVNAYFASVFQLLSGRQIQELQGQLPPTVNRGRYVYRYNATYSCASRQNLAAAQVSDPNICGMSLSSKSSACRPAYVLKAAPSTLCVAGQGAPLEGHVKVCTKLPAQTQLGTVRVVNVASVRRGCNDAGCLSAVTTIRSVEPSTLSEASASGMLSPGAQTSYHSRLTG